MSPATKLALRRFALRWLRKLVDVADDRLHAAEVAIREEISAQSPGDRAAAGNVEKYTAFTRRVNTVKHAALSRESFLEWEARRSGVAPVSKKAARQRRERQGAAAFDLRYAR